MRHSYVLTEENISIPSLANPVGHEKKAKIEARIVGVGKHNQIALKNSTCLLTISLGQESQQGAHLSAILNTINNTFGACTIVVGDILQRYTLAIQGDYKPENYYEAAKKGGDLWLLRHQLLFQKMTIPVKIIRWEHWLQHPDFQKQYALLTELLNTEPRYRACFDYGVEHFVRKYVQRLVDPNMLNIGQAKKMSFNYLFEECVALTLWSELDYQYELYPGKYNMAMEETQQRFVSNNHPNIKMLSIYFKNSKLLKPQKFNVG